MNCAVSVKENSVPIPDEVWSILVDDNGNPITGRGPQAGDFLARPPLPVHFDGTIDPPWIGAEDDTPAQRKARNEADAAANRNAFEKAIFDLSQTDSGREALEFAYKNNVHFVFDPETTDAQNARAINDRANKDRPYTLVLLRPLNATPQRLQLTIAHEENHEKFNQKDGVFGDRKGLWHGNWDAFQSAIIIVRAQEAQARLAEALHAIQCQQRKPADNPHSYLPKGVMDAFSDSVPAIAEAARHSAHFVSEEKLEKFAQNVMPAFYEDDLSYYDRAVISRYWQRDWMPQKNGQAWPHNSSKYMSLPVVTHAQLAEVLELEGNHYLHDCDFSLTSPQYAALSDNAEVRREYEKLRDYLAMLYEGEPRMPGIEVILDRSKTGPVQPINVCMIPEMARPHERLLADMRDVPAEIPSAAIIDRLRGAAGVNPLGLAPAAPVVD